MTTSKSSSDPFCNEPVIPHMYGGEELEGAEADTEELMADSHTVIEAETNTEEGDGFKEVLK